MNSLAVLLVGSLLPGQLDPLVHIDSLTEELRSPARVAITVDGAVLVTDPSRYEVVRFDAAGNLLGVWSVPECPIGVAAHPDGRYFVSYRDEPGVGIYDAGFTRTGLLGQGEPLVTFVRPTDIDIAGGTGKIYVVDSAGDRVYGFEANGDLALFFGEKGERLAEFMYPTALAVDEVSDRLIVADQDNSRVQVFATSGFFFFRFGYRNKYLVGGSTEGWMPRTQGVAVDGQGNIYVADALMSTVRIFDPTGTELGKVVEYGQAVGNVRTPCDIALSPDGQRLYVVSTNTSSVEVYSTPDLGTAVAATPGDASLDPPGTNHSELDTAYRRGGQILHAPHEVWKEAPRSHSRAFLPLDATGNPALVDTTSRSSYEGPHMIEASTICGRCHGMVGQPGDDPSTIEGQTALCFSCHSSGGQAMFMPLNEADMAGGSGPGRSHPWGVAAVNEAVGATGPVANGEMQRYLDGGGNIKCSTCHNQHSNDVDSPYLRVSNANGAMCKQCHTGRMDHTPSGGWLPNCNECHKPHSPASSNLALVATSIHNQTLETDMPVAFTARSGPNSFDDGDPAANDGVCQVCHTATDYHLHDGTGAPHNNAATCTACHPHDAGFMPSGGDCTACHSQPQDNGDGVPPGGRRAVVSDGVNPNDFSNTSHHYDGDIEPSACLVCHDLSEHQQGHVRLKDPDDGAIVYDHDVATADDMDAFCLNCHDADGASAGAGTIPFGDGRTVPNVKGAPGSLWASSAHKRADQHCAGCHGTNAHGSSNIKLLQAPAVDTLCYQCHTEGMRVNNALSGGVNDIQEAFSQGERHNLGTTFSVEGNTYELQCTTCHNPHIVTGKHWDVASGVSPVTRPDLGADPTTNPRAMGTALWGAISGEKMQDFAAQGAGTGGWYYSTARGGTIAWDQGGYYQPPKTASGYNFEFDGNVLPDYTTLCLDCHTHRMSAANPPVNWGQGVACTDNSVDPPDQRIECGAQHGLAAAGTPSYMSDSGTAGSWGASGNPDVLFHMNYVTRGRGAGHFMRWPYDSAERNAGINFVMSCTDCHEAHGSSAASMLRTTVNAYGPGTSNWNTMCNNCHYYYGGQHAGMSCGNASCHEANSIHRIIHVTDSGAGTQLRITASGYENDYQRPDFTPEIVSVEGIVGDADLTVTFANSVWANSDLSGSVTPDDFWFFDVGGNNPRTIDSVIHVPGSPEATLVLTQPLTAADLFTDRLATTGKSVWNWYDGGYVNWATGEIPAQAVSPGPWPVSITGGPSITAVELTGRDEILVTFDEGVYSLGGGALQPSNFVLSCAGQTIGNVVHVPGDATATLVLSTLLDGFDITTCIDSGGVAADALSIFDLSGNQAATTSLPIAMAAWTCPTDATGFQFNEASGSPYAFDEQDRLLGEVGNPTTAFQNGDGYFHGDGTDNSTYIYMENTNACLDEGRTFTYDVRFKPSAVDLDSEALNPGNTLDRTMQVLFQRRYSYDVKISRADFWGDGNPPPGKAFVYIWYRPSANTEGGRNWHQAFANNPECHVEADHWYRLRLVFNSDRVGGIPVDFFMDDQGTDGLGTGETWTGFINCTSPPGETDHYRSTEGNEIGPVTGKSSYPFSIGAHAANKNYALNGLMDSLSYQTVADYSGVDAPAPTQATPADGQAEIGWGAVGGATSYNLYWGTSSGLTPATGTLIADVTSPYLHSALTNGTMYYYIVTAMKNVDGAVGDEEIASSQVKAMPVNAGPSSPPANIVAESFKKAVTLAWDDAFMATSYNIYWSDLPGVTTGTGTLINGATSPFVHLGRTNETTYYYIITSVNSFGEYPVASAEVNATPNLHPTNVTAVAGDGQVEIGWDAVPGATAYNIYWETDSDVTRATANLISGVTAPYTHLGLINGMTYYYVATAVHPTGETFGPYPVNATPTAP